MSMAAEPTRPIEVDFLYVKRDERVGKELQKELSIFEAEDLTIWNDSMISAGRSREEEIESHLLSADIVLILVSPDLFSSEDGKFIYSKPIEMRRRDPSCIIIPIIFRATDQLKETSLGNVKALPSNGKPVADWRSRSSAFQDITKGFQKVVEEIRENRRRQDLLAQNRDEIKPSTFPSQSERKLSARTIPSPADPGFSSVVEADQQSQGISLTEGTRSGISLPTSEATPQPSVPSINGETMPDTSQSDGASQQAQVPSTTSADQPELTNPPSEDNKIAQAIIESQVEDKAVEENATADTPVQNVDKDALGFGVYVHALRDFIASPGTSTPLTIGIHGPWGSGKSSLMGMLKNELDPPLNFWSWLWIKKLWLKWYLSYLKGLFLWRFGKLLIWFDDKWGSMKKFQKIHVGQIDAADNEYKFGGPKRFREVRMETVYDPSLVASKGRIRSWLKIIREGLSYDPTSLDTDLDNPVQDATKPNTAVNLNGPTNLTEAARTNDEPNQSGLVSTNRTTNPVEPLKSDESLEPNEATDPSKVLTSTYGTNLIEATSSGKALKPNAASNSGEATRVEIASNLNESATSSEPSQANATTNPGGTPLVNGASQHSIGAVPSGTSKADDPLKAAKAAERLQHWQQRAASHFPMDPLTHPTIWFNAWKFDKEEQLWAALALEVMNQIKRKYWLPGRIIFWFRLTFKRFSFTAALWSVIKKVVLPLILGYLAWNYSFYITQILNNTVLNHDPKVFLQHFGPIINLGGLALWIGALLSGVLQIVNIVKDPFQIPVKEVFDKPNYKEKVGFLGSFQEDFSRIVSVVTRPHLGWKPQKLVIFIDDLDRCEPPKAADIIEGINIFLDSVRCVFVLGMDPTAVAASIETKYKDLFEQMRRETPGVVSPGRLFLDKIIQVPFHVPPSTGKGIAQLISDITQPKFPMIQSQQQEVNQKGQGDTRDSQPQVLTSMRDSSAPVVTTPEVDPASYKLAHIRQAISMGAKFLPENPRQVKKFVNLFRFYVYIADARGLLRYREEGLEKQKVGLTLDRLAIWVAWSIRWAEIAKPLSEEVQLANLREYLLKISKLLHEGGYWMSMEDAVKVCPKLGNLTLFPRGRSENGRDPVYDSLIKGIHKLREAEKDSISHWCHLPWEWWLLDPNFRMGVKEMESFWQEPPEGGYDWLRSVITWNRDELSTRGSMIGNQLLST